MHYSVTDIPVEVEIGDLRTRGIDCGDVYARHVVLPAGTDMTPLLAGLPGDMCRCPHWGQILEGAITVRYADGTEETSKAGEVYYWPGGHTGWTDHGVTLLEFSPTAVILPVLDHIGRQLVPS